MDDKLKACLKPSFMLFSVWKGVHPLDWHIYNLSSGSNDIYKTMVFADEHKRDLERLRRQLIEENKAQASSFVIARLALEIFEEIDL